MHKYSVNCVVEVSLRTTAAAAFVEASDSLFFDFHRDHTFKNVMLSFLLLITSAFQNIFKECVTYSRIEQKCL